MTRLTDAELAELLAGITPGPWSVFRSGEDFVPIANVGRNDAGDNLWVGQAHTQMHDGGPDADARLLAKGPDLLADLIAAREALRGMTAIFEQMLIHPDDTMYDARFWKQIAREGIAQGEIG